MKVYLVAGEPSGDLLAAGLMKALGERHPGVEFCGVGGESMKALGLKSLFDISEISVMGVFEVLPRLPLILKRLRQTVADIEERRPDVLVTVDSWGFVSSLLSKLKKRGNKIPVVHYVAPQVWAWKKGRAKNVAALVDRLMTLMPDEGRYFEKYGLRCDFVGHPVIERMSGVEYDADGFRLRHGIPPEATVIAVLPGSRRSEVRKLAPILRKSLEMIRSQYGEIYVAVPTVANLEKEIRRAFGGTDIPVAIVTGQAERYNAFRASAIALAKSGTVSLELAAAGTPHLIVYTFNALTNMLVRMVIKTPYANLINIMAREAIIPEFVLQNCRPELIAPEAMRLLGDKRYAAGLVTRAKEVLGTLRRPEALPSQAAARIVSEEAGAENGR